MLALFVLTVLLLLGAALMKTLTSSSETMAQEVLGTRALAAANSGMQAHLMRLFPLSDVAYACPADTTYNFNGVAGLNHCSAVVDCEILFRDNSRSNIKGGDVLYFTLESSGSCGTGNISEDTGNIVLGNRTVQVEAVTPIP